MSDKVTVYVREELPSGKRWAGPIEVDMVDAIQAIHDRKARAFDHPAGVIPEAWNVAPVAEKKMGKKAVKEAEAEDGTTTAE